MEIKITITILPILLVGSILRLDAQTSKQSLSANLPRYDRVVLLETTAETSANVSLGDLNGDGHVDVVLAKGRHWPLVDRVLLGDGKGQFPKSYDLSSISDRSYSGSLVDLDLDGDLDVVVSNDRPDPKLTYLNDGDGQFKFGSEFGQAKWSTRNASIADMNADGFPDIVVANRSGKKAGANYICINDGNGSFEKNPIAFSDYSSTTITPADFNGDGLVDLAVPHRDGGQSYVFVQTGKANFDFRKIPFGSPDATFRMSQAADLNTDGNLDIIAIDIRRGVLIYFQDTEGAFSSNLSVGKTSERPYALSVSDLNQDGATDIIIGYVDARAVILFNDGSGRSFNSVEFGDDKGSIYGFAVGDINEDGMPDIVAARSGAPNVLYLANPPTTQK